MLPNGRKVLTKASVYRITSENVKQPPIPVIAQNSVFLNFARSAVAVQGHLVVGTKDIDPLSLINCDPEI